jgi:hypothetical protein
MEKGFVIPAAVTQECNTYTPEPYGRCETQCRGAFVSSNAAMTGVPGVGGMATANQTMLGERELEIGSDDTVWKRIRR